MLHNRLSADASTTAWVARAAVIGLVGLLGASGCGGDDAAVWAMDPVWIEPTEAGGVHGFQTWEFFSKRWSKKFKDRFYVCSLVVEFEGEERAPDATCSGCTRAWEIYPSVLETDCDGDQATDSAYLSLRGLALSPVDSDLRDDDPFPGQSQGGVADYGAGWEPHGWAYPESLDTTGSAATVAWDGEQPFVLWPAYVWELGP